MCCVWRASHHARVRGVEVHGIAALRLLVTKASKRAACACHFMQELTGVVWIATVNTGRNRAKFVVTEMPQTCVVSYQDSQLRSQTAPVSSCMNSSTKKARDLRAKWTYLILSSAGTRCGGHKRQGVCSPCSIKRQEGVAGVAPSSLRAAPRRPRVGQGPPAPAVVNAHAAWAPWPARTHRFGRVSGPFPPAMASGCS